MQVQLENCKNLFIGCLKWWQYWYLHVVVFYLVHIVLLFFYPFLFCFLLFFPSPFFRRLLIFQCLGFSLFLRSFIFYFHFHYFNLFISLILHLFLPLCRLSSVPLLFLSVPPIQFPIILTTILKWVFKFFTTAFLRISFFWL